MQLPHFEQSHPGYQELLALQRKKFEALQLNEPKDWFDLVATVQHQWNGYRVTDSVAGPFLRYQLTIELYNHKKPGLWVDSSCCNHIPLGEVFCDFNS
jgi:hypothetical protein